MALANPLECVAASQRTFSQSFTVVGGALVAIKYKDGVMLAADTAATFGSAKRHVNYARIRKLGGNTLVAGGGELADFEYLMTQLKNYDLEDWCEYDGAAKDSAEYLSLISCLAFHRRSKLNPLLISVVVAGYKNDEPFLGYADQYGTVFEDSSVCSGLARYFATSFITERHSTDMNEQEAHALLVDAWKAIIAAYPRAGNTVQFATATAAGLNITEPLKIEIDWTRPSYFTTDVSYW